MTQSHFAGAAESRERNSWKPESSDDCKIKLAYNQCRRMAGSN